MVAITMTNGTICMAARILGVLYAHDDTGEKTYFVAQIQGAKRRLDPKDVATVTPIATS